MLKKERLQKVINFSKALKADELLISDSTAIFYLTGKRFEPGERFLALFVNKDGEVFLFLNELFRLEEDLGIDIVYYSDNDYLPAILEKYIDKNSILGVDKNLKACFLLPLIERGSALSFINASYAVDHARALKDPAEIEAMRLSSHINDLAMAEFKKLPKVGITELEVADKMLSIYKDLGAQRYSFEPIVAFGANGADPHHMPDHTNLKEGDMVLFDVGCVVDDYCSDMTRVFFFKQGPDAKQEYIYNLVREANEKAEAYCKAGIELASIDKVARDIISAGGYGKDFTHRLGHFIGIEDHDYGDVSGANHNLTEISNTFSIEPGIYSIKEGIGVRIEDLVLITAEGVEVLNKYPHDIEIIN